MLWVMLYNITGPMLCYITCVMLCYITCVMLCYITWVETVMQTFDFVSGLHNCLKFSQPFKGLYQAMQTRITFSIA